MLNLHIERVGLSSFILAETIYLKSHSVIKKRLSYLFEVCFFTLFYSKKNI